MTRQPATDHTTFEAALPDFSMNRQFLRSSGSGPALRIGIICLGKWIPRYAEQILEDIKASHFAKLNCVIEWPESTGLIPAARNSLLYRSYQKLVAALQPTTIDPLDLVERREDNSTESRPTVCRPSSTHPTAIATLVDQINAMQLDVIISFAAPSVNDIFRKSAAQGVWFYHLGHADVSDNGDDLVRKALENPSNTADIRLVRQNGNNVQTTILRQASYSLSPTLSAKKNRFAPYFGSSWFVIEKLAELHANGSISTLTNIEEKKQNSLQGPGNRLIIHYLAQRLRGIMTRAPLRLRHQNVVVHWKIALRRSQQHLPEQEEADALPQFRWLQTPHSHFWADPFLLEHDGKVWLFFEEYDRNRNKGHIACAKIDEYGRVGTVKTVLEKPWHLSYPQVFSHGGEVYMVPESVEHQTVDLYRARHFPDDWVHEKQLLDVAVVDATLQCRDGRWWMFASPMTIPGHAPITCLWTSDSLTGDWRLAPSHHVSDDVHHARNAGAIATHNGHSYRVSQDCATTYGAALWFNRIERWDENHYAETPEKCLTGNKIPGLTGIHSYNRVGDIEVIDGRFVVALAKA